MSAAPAAVPTVPSGFEAPSDTAPAIEVAAALLAAAEGGLAAKGLTTISAFGGSVASGVSAMAASVVEKVAEPEQPKTRTIMVTRGGGEPQSYKVKIATPQQ